MVKKKRANVADTIEYKSRRYKIYKQNIQTLSAFFVFKKRHNLNLSANWTKTKRARYKMCIIKDV